MLYGLRAQYLTDDYLTVNAQGKNKGSKMKGMLGMMPSEQGS
jgi:hypothetical protein